MAKPKKWVRNVKTVSTDPPKALFTKDAQTIAKTMAKKSVSPKGIGSGIRMIQYFINRAGKNLSMTRKRELILCYDLIFRSPDDRNRSFPYRPGPLRWRNDHCSTFARLGKSLFPPELCSRNLNERNFAPP